MSTTSTNAPTEATPTPVPSKPDDKEASSPALTERPRPTPTPKPKLRLELCDLTHPGTQIFLDNVNAATILSDAVDHVFQSLYTPFKGKYPNPGIASITLVLRAMDGVAYTTETRLGNDHKEIHFSLDYISRVSSTPKERRKQELTGVIVHEMVHVWQWNGLSTANGGLIEGIADFVRLRAGFAPPHWKPGSGNEWDAGYEATGYFLDWIDRQFGAGKVAELNDHLRDRKYEEGELWKTVVGHDVKELWRRYKQQGSERKTPVQFEA